MTVLDNSIRYLNGVGPVKASRLERLGVRTLGDLLFFFPRRYEDRRRIVPLKDLQADTVAASIVTVVSTDSRLSVKKRISLTRAIVSDDHGLASALWFNRKGLDRLLTSGTRVALYGKIAREGGMSQFVAPEFEILGEDEVPVQIGGIAAVYSLTAGLSDRWLRKTIRRLLDQVLPELEDHMPESILRNLDLEPLGSAIREMHCPVSPESWKRARRRLAFDELFMLQIGLAIRRRSVGELRGAPRLPMGGPLRRKIEDSLPFELTEDQSRVLAEIGTDMSSEVTMNRLLQGDVGSGKTAVATLAMMQAVDGGTQAALMVPTSILAQQHAIRLRSFLEPHGVKVGLLTGGLSARERRAFLKEIAEGSVDLIIGTHAVIQEDVVFHRLGLIVIDEQHRFGVLQRGALGGKGEMPHVLVMTATPIPRTLALSVYGDLSVSVIKTMPKGRIPVKTRWIGEHKVDDLYGFLDSEMDRGRRVFWVCPLIEESEHLNARPLEERFDFLVRRFGSKRVSMLHGRMSMEERRSVMEEFASGESPLLASTTVIEVGVDVPEATVMVIEGAERFGLSQLHQLRGRVGRSDEQSWCFLLGKPGTHDGNRRLEAICSSSDGFEVAEADMAIRGPGEICGTRQHGLTDFKVADLIRDEDLLTLARRIAIDMVGRDPALDSIPAVREMVFRMYREKLELAGTA
ncbi:MULTISPECIES: ATP-dependent DNA helicase RecG [Dethiosulfovibrio]|uniref:ATP-dependent DNA helicase RecG n=2 Tax=Dethiosulfovibrio TaxID=47054 RepID=A0ABS9EKL6_9BACT|nr:MULTISPECIES: ATP-dependent DNA helicase RecG [Dethiosulfovibrio]MCF4113833.1 ATP-dependent DNA helicase RecG [Dethiosulfovibrio russensis]MCF4141754.1 ATP-dependent DNA helicase RecG [Dethiosulfovibrio marinus]MCF4143829.1 ATP-dependent DNA helicase RecG [Dethiosulfovibrio acidaminovorans]